MTQILVLFIFSYCSNEREPELLSRKDILELSFYHDFPHFQSKIEQQLLKKSGIKSATFITTRPPKNEIDSTTYLTYDNEGRIINRTTSECTTAGCLPYITRQEYIYNDNKISRMDDYVFKRKYKNALDYWAVSDTNKLSKFDWEDYTYNNDTIMVESGSQKWKYAADANGLIIYKYNLAKTNDQIQETNYQHTSSDIIGRTKSSIFDHSFKFSFKVINDNKAQFIQKLDANNFYIREYLFDSKGLLAEIITYADDNMLSKTKITYGYYKKRT